MFSPKIVYILNHFVFFYNKLKNKYQNVKIFLMFLSTFSHNIQNCPFVVIWRTFVLDCFSAFVTFENDNLSLFGVEFDLYGNQKPLAIVLPVAGVYIHVQRTQAIWTMIAGRNFEWFDHFFAILANKTVIVFGKYFHICSFFLNKSNYFCFGIRFLCLFFLCNFQANFCNRFCFVGI